MSDDARIVERCYWICTVGAVLLVTGICAFYPRPVERVIDIGHGWKLIEYR